MPMDENQLRQLLMETALERATSAEAEEDGSVPAEIQEEIDALSEISSDPEKLKEFGEFIEKETGADNVQLSLGRSEKESSSSVVDQIVERGQRRGTRISDRVRRKLRAALKKKSRVRE